MTGVGSMEAISSSECADKGLDELDEQLKQFRQKRDELKGMLEVERTSTNMLAVVGQTQRNSHNDDNNDNEYKQQLIEQIVCIPKRSEGEELLRSYRLTGKTIFSVPNNEIGLRFETFFGGRYHESYYIILRLNRGIDQLEIVKHTIPHFIPIADIQREHLNTNIDTFISIIDNNLQAFVARREQLSQLENVNGAGRDNNSE
ncbi:811_t:CDS:2 [Paraglomus brasilianum]|uniref:811_t:CDS:1 n=1 Tax=Paraglomus brasilianum TaxID=144538 RepID=A0A9N9FYU2_9GLOM|nr:811_t:CDS:2 [Paraglomus brasilianum]